MANNNPLLKVRSLQVQFKSENGWKTAVQGIDFDVFRGKTLGIVGESGSGKSVSSLAIMRLLNDRTSRISADAIQLNDIDLLSVEPNEMHKIRGKKIAMIFQEPMTSLNPVFKCGFQVAEAIKAHENISNEKVKNRVIQLFQQVLLPRPEVIFNSYPHELSGGQKQRVMIAMAISCNPDLLIADEPTTALDVTVQLEILKLLKNLQKQTGMGMIFITHDLGVISELADDIAVMYNGTLVERGNAESILRNPQHPYTKGLLNCRPPLNVRLKRLPVVKEFLENKWEGGTPQLIQELKITDLERKNRLTELYQKPPILRVEGLKTWFPLRKGFFGRTYDNVKAVDEISFEVFEGETLGLVGESGCGKTTLGRSILRLNNPSGGRVFFEGKEITALSNAELRQFRKRMQIVFQDPYSSLNPRITIGSAIAEPMDVHHLESNAKKRRQKVCELLEQVGLDESCYSRYPHEFSGGQRQRICIARALAVNPKLIICDESVSALDVSVQAQVLNLLNKLKQEFHFTYIFISHDLSVVRFMSDRVLVMYNGKMVELADADFLFEHPQSDYTQKLIDALPGKRNHVIL